MQTFNKIRLHKPSAETVTRLKALGRKLLAEIELLDHDESSETQQVDFYEEVKRFEIELITRALTRSHGHQTEAARWINLNPTTLNAKIKQYHIMVNAFSTDIDGQPSGGVSEFQIAKQ
jgi:DNA-binding NtrC family response regulator